MNDLGLVLSSNEKMEIANELDRLFTLHDRPFPNGKKILYVDELSRLGYPFNVLIKGIRALTLIDLREISLLAIRNECWKYLPATKRPLISEEERKWRSDKISEQIQNKKRWV